MVRVRVRVKVICLQMYLGALCPAQTHGKGLRFQGLSLRLGFRAQWFGLGFEV